MRHSKLNLVSWFVAVTLSLLVAYWASLPVSEEAKSKVPVITIKEASVASIELSGAGGKVVATKTLEAGERWWISYERTPVAQQDTKGSASPSSERFVASQKFKDMPAQFAPLQAIRVIGPTSEEKLTEYGLKDGTRSLLLKDSSGATLLSLFIGKQLYGGRNIYAMNQSDSKVLLLAGDLISDFEKPELRFFERSLTAVTPEDVRAASLMQGGKTKRYLHTTKDAKGAAVWTLDGSNGDPVPQVSSWFDRLLQLKAASYATEEEEATLKSAPALFEVALEGGGAGGDSIQLKRKAGKDGPEYWAHSSHLNWHVRVASTRAETLEKDVPQILQD